ncbi:MAG TPA: HNH endonuclease signature motif containing protein, partial [Ktedonobacteraceae bacterium]|nr:HNH endonuclease signature motif containing protein [Ktedonobacteraceae bacterium]
MQQDMSNIGPPSESNQSIDLFSMPRSPQWPEVQHTCLKKNNYTCAACGIQGVGLVQVHHIIPFQYCVVYGRPELEFNPENLIPLCEGPGTNDHHVAIGHLGDFQHLNQDVLTDIT